MLLTSLRFTICCRFAFVLAIGLVGYKMFTKRKRGLLIEEEENEDYGTVPRAHVQVC
jgi:K+-transporting ATPase c subunit